MKAHIHLDPVGGISGDMFVAGVIDAFPELQRNVMDCVTILNVPHTSVCFRQRRDKLFKGKRFCVNSTEDSHHHHHQDFASIRNMLNGSTLSASTKKAALGIFGILAEAEARVHRVSVRKVAFHEIGAWDSIIDIVAAANLIENLCEYSWSIGKLPLGAGRVRTAHGMMPVPAPATLDLLEGFELIDDGVPGERVTPTGAAILCYLKRDCTTSAPAGMYTRSGVGFGSVRFPAISNILRVMVLQNTESAVTDRMIDEVSEICFDIDDQSAEDLAIALDRLRRDPNVFSVLQVPAFGKKGRMVTQVQILARPSSLDKVVAQCLAETATLGLRIASRKRVVVPRSVSAISSDGRELRVKIARRPAGKSTAKVENDDVASIAGRHTRDSVRRIGERLALEERKHVGSRDRK